MSIVQMYWGSSDIPSGIPGPGLNVQYHPTTGRGLDIDGGLAGSGCGKFTCGERTATLTFLGRFYLQPQRMPEQGRLFVSQPGVDFSGRLRAETDTGTSFDNSSVRVGLRLRQYIYSGTALIGWKEIRRPRVIDLVYDSSDWRQTYMLPDTMTIPAFCWELNRSQTLEIDIEVRFLIRLEGHCSLSFWSYGDRFHPDKFIFDVPQWFVEKCNTGPFDDDTIDRTRPPAGGSVPRHTQ
jgi:hypothetical protein